MYNTFSSERASKIAGVNLMLKTLITRISTGIKCANQVKTAQTQNVNNVSFRYITATRSDPGCVRTRNEDSFAVERVANALSNDTDLLLMVADGMGGHNGGQEASRLAVSVVQADYRKAQGQSVKLALFHAFIAANQAIYSAAQANADLRGMGTTGTAIAIRQNRLSFAHVGDSRLYRLRQGVMEQLSEDHTLIHAMIKDGLLNEEQASNHPDRHIIIRALGTRPTVDVMVSQTEEPVQEFDTYLLCSDGLHDLVSPEEIKSHLQTYPPSEACDQLVVLAKSRGGHDNITVIILQAQNDSECITNAPITRDHSGDFND